MFAGVNVGGVKGSVVSCSLSCVPRGDNPHLHPREMISLEKSLLLLKIQCSELACSSRLLCPIGGKRKASRHLLAAGCSTDIARVAFSKRHPSNTPLVSCLMDAKLLGELGCQWKNLSTHRKHTVCKNKHFWTAN